MVGREDASVLSALWAAYGDALGFVTELTDKRGVSRRTGGDDFVSKLLPWKRRIGGKMGPDVELPAGCYSDDTELRLASCRAIRANGYFDVESFAKIELTVWPAYALGAGRGSKSAATNLARTDVNWFTNFFEDKGRSYFDSGGNGAAMRVQPHVWCAKKIEDPSSYLPDVIRNSICTHGHPRGIAGAVFHAACLAYSLEKGRVPGPKEWKQFAELILMVPSLISSDDDLAPFWKPEWEARVSASLECSFQRVYDEVISHIDECGFAASIPNYPTDFQYQRAVEALNGLSDSDRGSGTKTAVLAAFLTWLYRDSGPADALSVAANLLSSDTDSIATMAGAIFGATGGWPFSASLRDKEYIITEAQRMWRIAQGWEAASFDYPDVFTWVPPKTFSDAVLSHGDHFWLCGLGRAIAISEEIESKGNDAVWQWLRTDFGQTFLAKRRRAPENHSMTSDKRRSNIITKKQDHLSLFPPKPSTESRPRSIDELTREAIASNFSPDLVGRHLVDLATGQDGVERAIAYAAIIAKARLARERK